MKKLPRIDFIGMSMSDASELVVLKSKHNRIVAQLRREAVVEWGKEQEELLTQLKHLKEQIDQYE